MTFGRALRIRQPPQCAKTDIHRLRVTCPSPAENQRVRQLGIVVGNDLLEPGPVVAGVLLVQLDEPRSETIAVLIHQSIAAHSPQVLMNADECECPRSW